MGQGWVWGDIPISAIFPDIPLGENSIFRPFFAFSGLRTEMGSVPSNQDCNHRPCPTPCESLKQLLFNQEVLTIIIIIIIIIVCVSLLFLDGGNSALVIGF